MLILISAIRYFINGFFSFFILNNQKNSLIRNVIIPSIISTIATITFKIFIIDSPIITLFSAAIIFVYLLLKNGLKDWRFSLTYSLFISYLMECIHILIFKIASIERMAFQFSEITYSEETKLIYFRAIIVLLYAIVLFLICRFNLINVESVYTISNYNLSIIFLSIAMISLLYLKYYIKYTDSNEFHNILSVVFLLFASISFILIILSNSLLNAIKTFQKNKINPAIEEAKLQKGKRYAGMCFISEKFNSQLEFYKNELEKIGMDKQDYSSLQIAFSAVLLQNEESPNTISLRSKIYFYISEILCVQPSTVESNISYALRRHWTSADPKILKMIELNYDGPISEKNAAPTPKEFLLYLIKKSK